MARPATHIWRLGKWARVAARHGALRGIRHDPNAPVPVKRLIRLFSIGTVKRRVPDYAGAFRAIGPAAIKLGQTLATRPDIVGEEAARNRHAFGYPVVDRRHHALEALPLATGGVAPRACFPVGRPRC